MAWIAVLCENGLPSPEAWTAEMQAAGLDIEVHPFETGSGNPWDLVPMSVRGNLAPLSIMKAADRGYGWSPQAIPREHSPEARVLKAPREDAAEWEEAAEWAAVASLQRLGYARLFDPDGHPLEEPSSEVAYERARRLMAGLTPKPHPVPGDSSLDYRSQKAREYDQRHETYVDFDWDAPNELLKKCSWSTRRRGRSARLRRRENAGRRIPTPHPGSPG